MSGGVNALLIDEVDAVLTTIDASPARGPSHVEDVLRGFLEIDKRLVEKGFPRTSRWWRRTIARWYRSGKRQLTARVGRRGGKSSTLSRLGTAELLYGHHDVPPGDIGVLAVISIERKEAKARLTTVKAVLDALDVKYEPWGDEGIKLVGRRLGVRVYTGTVGGVSGFTAVFVFADEVAKWRDKETGANPATEVLRSVRPTILTQRNARMVLSSSPFGMLDAHFDAFEEGETKLQTVAYAPTWEANPTTTEEETHDLESDPSTWLREYKGIPQAEVEFSLLSQVVLDACTRGPLPVRPEHAERWPWLTPADRPPEEGHRYVATMDPATVTNAWTFCIATKGLDGVRRVVFAREWRPKPGLPLSARAICAEMKVYLTAYGLSYVYTDQHAAEFIREPAGDHKIALIKEPWTLITKRVAYENVLTLSQDDRLELPPDPVMKTDLLGIRKRITRNGVTYELAEQRGGRHSDYAPAVAMALEEARMKARPVEGEKGEEDRQTERKRKFLEDRVKERERARKLGRKPVTHTMRRA